MILSSNKYGIQKNPYEFINPALNEWNVFPLLLPLHKQLPLPLGIAQGTKKLL
jgi:hypothetical protein